MKDDDQEWGNIQLPGLSDEKLHSTNWNLVKTEQEKEHLRAMANKQWEDEQSRQRAQAAQERRKLSGWNEKMKGNTNGSGARSKPLPKQTAESNARRSATLMGRVIPSITGVPKPKETCPHCGKIGGRPQMLQYHFDRCKHKQI